MVPSLFKEGSNSVSQYYGWFANHAQRTVVANKALAIKVDEHLGVILFDNKSFRVRRIPPCRYGFEITDFSSQSDVNDFVTYAAKALALAHTRADKDYNPTYIDYNFEQAYFAAIVAWSQFNGGRTMHGSIQVAATQYGLSLKAYRGDGGVLLAFDLDQHLTANLAGLVQCTPPHGPAAYLLNRLSFDIPITATTKYTLALICVS